MQKSAVTFSTESNTVHTYECIRDEEKFVAFYSQREIAEFEETDRSRKEASSMFSNEEDLEEYLEYLFLEKILEEENRREKERKTTKPVKFASQAFQSNTRSSSKRNTSGTRYHTSRSLDSQTNNILVC